MQRLNNISLNIMVADDEPLMRNLVGSFLINDFRHEIIKVRDGQEALNMFQSHHEQIDMCFLDIEMPKIDGLKLIEEFRKISPDAWIVILSGAGSFENVKKAINSGVNGFIVKPFCKQKIGEAVNNYLKHLESQMVC